MIDSKTLAKERLYLINGMLFYIDTLLEPIDNQNEKIYYGVLGNNETIRVIINNDTLIIYKEFINDDYQVFNYSIRDKGLHSNILIKDHKELEIFLRNNQKQDMYISIDKDIISSNKEILEIIKNNINQENTFDLISESLIDNLSKKNTDIKHKTYTKKREYL